MAGKHWTKFLPEAGTITRRGDEQESILRQIDDYKKKIRSLQIEYNTSEESLTKFCISPEFWTAEEVETAKKRAKKPNHRL